MPKLTKYDVRAAQAAERDYVLWCESPRGFGLKVTPKGRKVFIVDARVRGNRTKRRFTLGPADALTLDEARKRAGDLIAQCAEGIDPADEEKKKAATRKAVALEDERRQRRAFRVIAEEYLSRRVRGRLKDVKHIEGLIALHFTARWAERDIATISRTEVLDVLEELEDLGKAGAARKARAVVSPLFTYAVQKGHIPTNPAAGRHMLSSGPTSRDRVLSGSELVEVWQAAEQLDWPFGRLVKLLIVTGQRLREVAEATWGEFDLDNRLWTIPAGRSKNGRAHVVHLSAQAVDVLETLPRFKDCALLFTTNAETPVSGFSKAKRQLDKLIVEARKKIPQEGEATAAMPHWTFHDLRRAFASGAASLGVQMHIVERVLNHIPTVLAGVAQVYQRHEFLAERRLALDMWGKHVEAINKRSDASNVLAFPVAHTVVAVSAVAASSRVN